MDAAARFADNLRRARGRRGLTQEELGELTDVHRTEISLLERQGRDPRLSTVIRLANGLGVSASELLKGIR